MSTTHKIFTNKGKTFETDVIPSTMIRYATCDCVLVYDKDHNLLHAFNWCPMHTTLAQSDQYGREESARRYAQTKSATDAARI